MILDKETLMASRIPQAYWRLNADTYPGDKVVLKQIDEWCKSPMSGLFIYGPSCSGRTFLLSYIGRYLLDRGVTYYTFEESVEAYFEKKLPVKGGFFLWDDLCAVHGNNYMMTFRYIVKHFPGRGVRLVIASSVDRDELSTIYNDSYADVIFRHCRRIETHNFRNKLQLP